MPLDIPLPSASVNADPQQYIPLLLSAVEGFLQLREVWADADYGQAFSYMEQLKVYIVECFGKCSDMQVYPIQLEITPWTVLMQNGQTLTKSVANGYAHNGTAEVTPIAQDNSIRFFALLAAGTYNFEMWGLQATNCGITQFIIDGVTNSGETDWYGSTFNNTRKTGSFEITEDGLHEIHIQVTKKRAASTSYRFLFGGLSAIQSG